MKKFSVFLLTLFLVCALLNAAPAVDDIDELLLSGVPFVYGEESFISRIEERSVGREPVGLVLTGGSARAFAHIGVLQYLEDQGLVPDFIISNSMGSIIAMLYAAGLSPAQLLEICSSTDIGALFDLAIPVNRGLINTDRFESLIAAYLGRDLRVESLAIPVMIVSEDLRTKRQVHICEGDFYQVLIASFAMPVYFSSVKYNGHVLTDGGIADIAPVNIAYRYGSNNIISSTFYSGKNTNLNNPLTVLNTAFDIGKRRQGVSEILANPEAVWIRCGVEDFSFMEFSASRQLAQRGYESALAQAEPIKALVSKGGGVTEELAGLRKDFDAKIEQVLKDYRPFSHTAYRRASFFGTFEGRNYNTGRYHLKDGMSLGLGYKFGVENFDFMASVGLWGRLDSRNFDIAPEVSARMNAYFLPSVRLSLEGMWLFRKEVYAAETLEWAIPLKIFGGVELSLGETFEYSRNFNAGTAGDLLLSFWLSSDFEKGRTVFNRIFAFELKGKDNSATADRFIAGYMTFSQGFWKLPLGVAGRLDTSLNLKTKVTDLDTSLRLFWNVSGFQWSFAETFLFTNLYTGAFADFSFSMYKWKFSADISDLKLGAFVSTDIGLIGLRTAQLDLKAGYDFGKKAPFVAITIGQSVQNPGFTEKFI